MLTQVGVLEGAVQLGQAEKKAPRTAGLCATDNPTERVRWSCFGGEGGIRTLGSVATTPDFESGTFDHSATSPEMLSKREF